MAGAFVGSLIAGVIADTYGRRKTLLVSMFLQLVLSFAMVLVPGYAAYAIFRALFGFISTGSSLTMGMIPVEMVGLKWRNHVIMGSEFFFPGGLIILLAAGYFVRNWRMLILTITCPFVILFFIQLRYVPESMRWLISKKRYGEARRVMLEMARVNKTLQNVQSINLEEIEIQPQSKSQLRNLFSTKNFMFRSLIVGFVCFVMSMTYYGVSLNIGNLMGNFHLNFLLIALAEIPGYTFGYLMLDRIGRPKSLCLEMLVAGIACICIIIPILTNEQELYPFTLVCISFGKIGISAAFGVQYLYMIELFPTSFRNTFLGYASSCLRLGGIMCTYIADSSLYIEGTIGRIFPLLLFGGLACLAGLSVLVLPETAGKTMPESFKEAQNFEMNIVKADKMLNDSKFDTQDS